MIGKLGPADNQGSIGNSHQWYEGSSSQLIHLVISGPSHSRPLQQYLVGAGVADLQ